MNRIKTLILLAAALVQMSISCAREFLADESVARGGARAAA